MVERLLVEADGGRENEIEVEEWEGRIVGERRWVLSGREKEMEENNDAEV